MNQESPGFIHGECQSVYDVLRDNGIEDTVLRDLHTSLYHFGKTHRIAPASIGHTIQYQEEMLGMIKTTPEPLSKSGMKEILELAFLLCSQNDNTEMYPQVDAVMMMEYALAVTETSNEIISILKESQGT